MTILHPDPPSGVSTGTLTLTSRMSPYHKQTTPTATLSAVSFALQSLPSPKPRPATENLHHHELEQLDVEAELRADGDNPFPIDRRAVKEVVQEKLGVRIARITFLSSGTFHKAFLLHLAPNQTPHSVPQTVVFRIARRTMHMPRLKTESEVATLAYLRTRTSVPVPTVYWYDANPYNSLGGEWMVMSKAPGVPLSKFYHTLPAHTLRALLANLAGLLIPLFEHRFPALGSLYYADAARSATDSTPAGAVSLTATLPSSAATAAPPPDIVPGPIVSYPFFGSSRGLLSHTSKPAEIDRGPWSSFEAYLAACAQREIDGVVREGQGREVGHRPRVAPTSEEGSGSGSGSGSEDDDEDDWGVDWGKAKSSNGRIPRPSSSYSSSGDGDSDTASNASSLHESYYRDYRATQRSTFLVAHTARREASVREEMGVFVEVMAALREEAEGGLGLGEFGERGKAGSRRREEDGVAGEEEFTLDCHDLSLENVFVDEYDHSKITCIIDWESTCIRPLFQAAHLPSFLQPHHGHGHHHGHHHSHHHSHHHHHHRPHSHSHSHTHTHSHTPQRPHMSRTHSHHHNSHHHTHHHTHHTHHPRYIPSHAPAAQIFREEVARLGCSSGAQWLQLEEGGAKRRWAHRVVEWDGWEEGLAGEILGELEYGWEVEGGGGGGGAGGAGKKKGRDVSADGGRELGRRLELWVQEGANVGSYAVEVDGHGHDGHG